MCSRDCAESCASNSSRFPLASCPRLSSSSSLAPSPNPTLAIPLSLILRMCITVILLMSIGLFCHVQWRCMRLTKLCTGTHSTHPPTQQSARLLLSGPATPAGCGGGCVQKRVYSLGRLPGLKRQGGKHTLQRPKNLTRNRDSKDSGSGLSLDSGVQVAKCVPVIQCRLGFNAAKRCSKRRDGHV